MEKSIGPYKILEELGKGATSICYRAVKPPLEREFLLKILYPQFAQDTEVVARFEREARIISRLTHPNVVQILDFGKINDTYFIAMESVKGKSLKEMFTSRKFTPKEAISIIIYLLDALSYVHKRSVVHRDIKPSNIIVTKEGIPKLTDFGLAWAKSLSGITTEGTFLGTPEYMSLEQLKGEKVDQRADIYSLGIVFLELLTGVKAYEGDNYTQVIQNVLTRSPRGINELANYVNDRLAMIVKKMIEKDKTKRYESANAVLDALMKLQGKPVPKRRRVKASLLISYSIACLLLLLVGWHMKKLYSLKAVPKEVMSEKSASETTMAQRSVISERRAQSSREPLTLESKRPITQQTDKLISFPLYIYVLPYAKVWVDGSLVGESPPGLEADIPAGSHTLTFESPRFPKITKQIEIKKGEMLRINLFQEVSYLQVKVKPWAEVWVDGTPTEVTPLAAPLILAPGYHEIRLHHPYYKDYVDTLDFKRRDTLKIDLTFKK
ncbi:MAG: serine/threonine-protein kinase [bacterium]|nr:serine/threonine-protein kinase [bacterium]